MRKDPYSSLNLDEAANEQQALEILSNEIGEAFDYDDVISQGNLLETISNSSDISEETKAFYQQVVNGVFVGLTDDTVAMIDFVTGVAGYQEILSDAHSETAFRALREIENKAAAIIEISSVLGGEQYNAEDFISKPNLLVEIRFNPELSHESKVRYEEVVKSIFEAVGDFDKVPAHQFLSGLSLYQNALHQPRVEREEPNSLRLLELSDQDSSAIQFIAVNELVGSLMGVTAEIQREELLYQIAHAENGNHAEISQASKAIYSDIINHIFDAAQDNQMERQDFINRAWDVAQDPYVGFDQEVASEEDYQATGKVGRRESDASSEDSVIFINPQREVQEVPKAFQDAQRFRGFTYQAPIQAVMSASVKYFSHLNENPKSINRENQGHDVFISNRNALIHSASQFISSYQSQDEKELALTQIESAMKENVGKGKNSGDKVYYMMSEIKSATGFVPQMEKINKALNDYVNRVKEDPKFNNFKTGIARDKLVAQASQYINGKESNEAKLSARLEVSKMLESSLGKVPEKAEKVSQVMGKIENKLEETNDISSAMSRKK